jgi:hypothetical protein
MAEKYRKKPEVIEAIQWHMLPEESGWGDNRKELFQWYGVRDVGSQLLVATRHGDVILGIGDWVCRQRLADGSWDYWPVEQTVFAEKYEKVDAEAEQPPTPIYVHCGFVPEEETFKLTMTLVATGQVVTEWMADDQHLERWIKVALAKPEVRVQNLVVTLDDAQRAQVREYLELVLSSYRQWLEF